MSDEPRHEVSDRGRHEDMFEQRPEPGTGHEPRRQSEYARGVQIWAVLDAGKRGPWSDRYGAFRGERSLTLVAYENARPRGDRNKVK